MPLETVEIAVLDDTIAAQPVDDVVIRVYDEAGAALITEATSGSLSPGRVQLTLNGEVTPERYQLRFYIAGGRISSPQYIDVYSPPGDAPTGANNFEVEATVFTLPSATNPRLCRASGYIWGPDGRPIRGIDMAFVPLFRPLVVDGFGVLGERVNARTDKDGYIEIDLIRNGMYYATVESQENVQREVCVPDRSSINIMHLLFPIVIDFATDPAAPLSLATGASLSLTPTITSSDYRVLAGTAPEDVQYAVDDPSVAAVTIEQGRITIHGLSAGSTNLRVIRKDETIVYIPDPGINGAIVPITVT
jgi:hypothetical protein